MSQSDDIALPVVCCVSHVSVHVSADTLMAITNAIMANIAHDRDANMRRYYIIIS